MEEARLSSSDFLQRIRRGYGLRIGALAGALWLAGGCAYLPGNDTNPSGNDTNLSGNDTSLAGNEAPVPAGEETASKRAPEPPPKPPRPTSTKREREPRPSHEAPTKPIAEPEPAAPATVEPPSPIYIESDLLEIERSGGVPVAVLLEAGASEGLTRGMVGELLDRGQVIGSLEIIAVYDEGSRARIVGELSVPITFETSARIRN
jgi:hypothetical protein